MTNTASIDGGVMAAVLTPLTPTLHRSRALAGSLPEPAGAGDVPVLPSSGPPARQIPSAFRNG